MSRSIVQLPSVILVIAFAVSAGGCGSVLPGHFGGVATQIPDEVYAEKLCGYLDLEAYPACFSAYLDRLDMVISDDQPGHGTSGPFMVVMDGGVYSGSYSSSLFSAQFQVSNGENACRGSFGARSGSQDALFDVYCDDGRSGWADIIQDIDGRNGIGQVTLNDGTKGDIVYGYRATGMAEPYPWGDVWTPKVSSAER